MNHLSILLRKIQTILSTGNKVVAASLWGVLISGYILTGCSTSPDNKYNTLITDAVQNQSSEIVNENRKAEYYIHLASETSGKLRQHYLIKAAEELYAIGDFSSAEAQLQNIEETQPIPSKQHRIRLLAAKIALANNNPQQAIDVLPKDEHLSRIQLIEAKEIRAASFLQQGYQFNAINTRVALDRILELKNQKENHKEIWEILAKTPLVTLNNFRPDNDNFKGWIDLALILRNAQKNILTLQEEILDWGTMYPNHPVSNSYISQLMDEYIEDYSTPENIAVLLPTQGLYKDVAEAIRAGLLSAFYQDDVAERPFLQFIDTSVQEDNFLSKLETAVKNGATHAIGPIDKETISDLLSERSLDVPVLSLNYAENPFEATNNLYQFGLLPEDEVKQVAELASIKNNSNAALLVPDSDWGRRLAEAFRKEFEKLGGEVIVTQYYETNTGDYSKPIKHLLNLQESETRHRQLSRLFNAELQFKPYRRQDIDMIFLAATHQSARGILPALKFHHAGNIPVFSTSHVYTGKKDTAADRDLNGLIFCDIPWTLVSTSFSKKSFEKTWSDKTAYTRLFAVGVDAYHLIRNLNYLKNHSYARFSGETGNIFLDKNNRLHRKLLWAQFKYGKPVHLETGISQY